jgi:predicted nucleic acid-binding protein
VTIVADAGPLLHLFWVGAGAWALPSQTIDVVDEVWEEVQAHAAGALADPRLRHLTQPQALAPDMLQWNLDRGERAALSYALSCRSREEVLVLCDERAARRACAALSLPVVGSIGLILEASRASRVSLETASAALQDLPGRGRLHVRPQLVESALAALHDSP